MVEDIVETSDWDFISVNVRELVKYIAMNCNQGMIISKGLKEVIPLRTKPA